MMARLKTFPAERIIANLQAYLKEHPEDTDIYYKLGRAYYAAFVSKDEFIKGYLLGEEDHQASVDPAANSISGENPCRDRSKSWEEMDVLEIPRFLFKALRGLVRWIGRAFFKNSTDAPVSTVKSDTPKTPVVEEAERDYQKAEYLRRAIENLQEAMRREPSRPEIYMTLGGVYQQGTPFFRQVPLIERERAGEFPLPNPEDSAEAYRNASNSTWRAAAARAYLRAFDLSHEKELEGVDVFYGDSFSVEAAQCYLKLADEDPRVIVSKADPIRVQALMKAVKASYHHWITPVIVSLRPNATLAAITDADNFVDFDVDGTGRPQHYSWVRHDTGILVWDPEETGKITSGRQLFGSVTWWIFWRNGYEALDALDDDRDGWLTGAELAGIHVWFDRNGNGVCEPGEVMTLESLGIEGISCRASAQDGDTLVSREGVRLRDGRVLPTWDWIPQSFPAEDVEGVSPTTRRRTRNRTKRAKRRQTIARWRRVVRARRSPLPQTKRQRMH